MKAIVNLAGYFITPFQLIMDINAQLPTPCERLSEMAFRPLCELNTTNDWINLEALGNPVALRADEMQKALLKVLNQEAIQKLELHIYCADADISIDNIFALLYLTDALPVELYLYTDNISKLHQSLIPLSEKKKQHLLIQKTRNFEADLKDKLQSLKIGRQKILQAQIFHMSDEWLGKTEISLTNMGLIIGYAWACLKSGAYEIGCNLIEHILNEGNAEAKASEHLFMHLQLIRFLSHQYEKVTQEQFPEQFQYLTSSDSTNLYFIKAYAATLSRNLAVAEICFKKAGVDSSLPMTDEVSLFRLNLHALFLVLSGNTVAALSQEHQIEEFIAKNAINTLGLKYVNYINIARVYKKLNQFETALDYYKKAYQEIQGGGFTASDHVYYNMNFGGLFEAAGQAEKALFYWVKAALHWLTFDNPYALAWRPRVILCEEKVTEILTPLDAGKIHLFLFKKINHLLTQTQFSLENISKEGFTFIPANEPDIEKESCYLAESIILYRCKTDKRIIKKQDPKAEALKGLLTQVLRKIMKSDDDNLLLQVDNHLENDYPESAEDCITLAILSGCKHFYYQGQYIQFNVDHINNYFANAKMTLSTVIQSIQPLGDILQLSCRRSFLNQKLDLPEEINLIKHCAENKSLKLDKPDLALVKTLSRLMTEKILVRGDL